ncbi:MAG: endo-1,4-beta-xylanase [Lentisphaeria bacterium]|nr:endo-1,4-beta-xylanase [Lentisphaeria bacterium]
MSWKDDFLKPFREDRELMDARIKSGIELYRKGSLKLLFKDKDGKPVPGVHVKIRQKTHDFRIGANLFMLDEFDHAEQNAAYRELFAGLFNTATLPFYWNTLEPEQGKPRFAKDSPKIYRRPAPDLCLEYCEANGIEPKAHCLNYAYFTPDWAKGTVAWEKKCLEKRFRELAERYAGRIPMWEVTNETYWGGFRFDSAFYQQPDFVEWSFALAEQYFPANRLVINEAHSRIWGLPSFHRDRSLYYMQIERALARGARIDEIGMQFHLFYRRENLVETLPASIYTPRYLYDAMDCYARLDLPMHITEMTIPAYSGSQEDEETQAEVVRNLYSIFFSHPAMTGVIYWNLVDGFAYGAEQGDMTAGENSYFGGLVRYDFTPKPAYNVLKNLFQKEWHTELEKDAEGDTGALSFRGFYGTYDLEITSGDRTFTKEIRLNRDLSPEREITL